MKNLLYISILVLTAVSCSRISTAYSIKKVSNYDDYNIYEMDVKYDYNLDSIIAKCGPSDSSYINAVISEVIPYFDVKIATPKFGCSSFAIYDVNDDHYKMGRSYDFRYGTSAMVVRCHPKDGYSSVAIAALGNLQANQPDSSLKKRLTALASPFACLDGINEKGVSISVLSLDSKPTRQNRGKPILGTAMAIRLVLDRAASTEEAIKLLNNYDMFSTANIDYHFYISDSTGDGRVIEYDPRKEHRDLVAIKNREVTNFYVMFKDSIETVGHGCDRYMRMDSIFNANEDKLTAEIGWEALKSVSRGPSKELRSNTQWSSMYDNTVCNVSVVLRRHWQDKYNFNIEK